MEIIAKLIKENLMMDISVEVVRKIYDTLGDEVSKDIFMNRMMYSFSGDFKWIRNLVLTNKKIKEFVTIVQERLQGNEIVIFGAGKRGKQLCDTLNFIPWKCLIDNNPQEKEVGGVPVVSYSDFLVDYRGESVVISSRIYRKEMKEQLAGDGIVDNVIDFGEILDELIQNQYFDLEYMRPMHEREIFVDAGCYDAGTAVNFAKWCKGKSFVYAFEPDSRRINECIHNLQKNKIDFKLIPKGVWNKETVLKFNLSDRMCSSLCESGKEVVEVVSIDKALGDESVTFIKMDIEGSELQALQGAKAVIIKNRPRLAISIYHKIEDVFLIPDVILQYCPDYKLYLRHYSITHSETVLYALPGK